MKTLLDHLEAEQFLRELQEDHLSEVEFLLVQRQHYFIDPERSWLEAEELETRLARHVAALRAGGQVALDCARQLLAEGDMGQYLAALHVLASLAPEEVAPERVLEARAEPLQELLPPWHEALVLAQHADLARVCTRALRHEQALVRAAAARLLGHRREGQPVHLLPLLSDSAAEVRAAAAVALAQLGHRPALSALERLLPTLPAEDCSEQLLRAALLLGSGSALERCCSLCRTGAASPALIRLLAMAGSEWEFPLLRSLAAHPATAAPALEALGILGMVDCVPQLLESLASPEPMLQLAAASALNLITGANLVQKVLVPDEQDEDSPGREVEQPSTAPQAWHQWWNAHRHHFRGAARFRQGVALTPAACLAELEAQRSLLPARTRAALELALRLGEPTGLEPDWPVHRQKLVLARWRGYCAA